MRDGSLYRVEASNIPRALMEKYDQRRFGDEGIKGKLAEKGKDLESATSHEKRFANYEARQEKAVGQKREDEPQMSMEEYQARWQAQAREWGYEPSLFSTKEPEAPRVQVEPVAPSLLDEAMQRIVDSLAAIRAEVVEKTHALNAARENNDKPRIAVIGAELTKARAALAPKTEQEFAAVIRTEKGVRYASQAEISAAIERALDKAQLVEHGNGKLSVETEREFDRRVAMAAAADRGYAQYEVNRALSLTIEAQATGPARADLHVAQAREAMAKQDLDGFGRAASELRDARPTFSQAQLSTAIRSDVPHAKPDNIKQSFEQAAAAGGLQVDENKLAPRYAFETAGQATERNSINQEAVKHALDKVIANQAEKVTRVVELTSALKEAVAAERVQAIEAARAPEQEKAPTQDASTVLSHDQAYAKAQALVDDLAAGRKTLADLGTGAEVVSRKDTQAIAEALNLPKLEQGGAVAEALQIQQHLAKAPTIEESRSLVGAKADRAPAAMAEVTDALKGALQGQKFESVQEVAGAIQSSLEGKSTKLAEDLSAAISKADEAHRAAGKELTPDATVKAVVEVVDRQRGLTVEDLAGAVGRKLEGQQTAKELLNELKAATADVAKTEAGWARTLRAEVPGASAKDASAAIQVAVADGKLNGYETKYGTMLTAESKDQSNDRRLTEQSAQFADRNNNQVAQQYEKAAIAADRVISRMEDARETVKGYTEALGNARAMRDERGIEAAQKGLKEANKALAGVTQNGFDYAVRKELAAMEKPQAPAKEQSIAQELITPAEHREAKIEAYAAKVAEATVAAFEKARVPTAEKTPAVQIGQDVLDAVRKDALSQGRMHENAGKLSIETEKETTLRLEGHKAATKDYRSAVQQDKFASDQEQRIERQAARNEKGLAQKAERLQGMSLEARQRENWPTYTKTVKNTKAVIRAISNPKLAAKRMALGAAKSLGLQSLTLADTVLKATAAAVIATTSLAVKGRESSMAHAKGAQKTLGKQLNVTSLSKAGFHVTQSGEVHRMQANLSNAVLTAGIKTLELSQLTRTSVGMAVRNEMLKNISTKRVDGLEAWTVKAVAAVAKGISDGLDKVVESKAMERVGQAPTVRATKDLVGKVMEAIKGPTREQKFGKEFEAAAKEYGKARESFRLGTMDEKTFRAEHAKFEAVIEKGRDLNRDGLDKATTTYENRMRDARIDREANSVAQGIREGKGNGVVDKALSLLESKEPEKRDMRDPEHAREAAERIAGREDRAAAAYGRAVSAFQEKEGALSAALPSADDAVMALKVGVMLDAAHLAKNEAVSLRSIGEADVRELSAARETIRELKADLSMLPSERSQDQAVAKVLGRTDREMTLASREPMPEKSIGRGEQKVAEQVEVLKASGADKSKAVSLEQPEKAANQVEQAVSHETKDSEQPREKAHKARPDSWDAIRERLAKEGKVRDSSQDRDQDLSR